MGDDKDNKGGIGFSGISSLLPDDPPDAPAQQPAPAAHPDCSQSAAVPPANGATGSTQSKSPASASQPTQPAPRPRSGGGAVWAWIGGVAVVILVIWAVSQSGSQPSSQSASQSPVVQGDSSTQPSTPTQNDQANAATATAQQSAVPALQRPPVGSGNIFSVGEIRYCLVLKQWVEGAQPAVDTYSQDQVDRFNKMVDDYNSRCHDFRYQTGDLEKAKRDIAPYIQRFQTLSRQWVQYGEIPGTNAQRPDAQAATRTMVDNAQRALNTLGYNVGRPDGIVGARTLTAIERFQRQNGLPVNGLVTASLIERLQSAEVLRSHPEWEVPSSAYVADGTPERPAMDAGDAHSVQPQERPMRSTTSTANPFVDLYQNRTSHERAGNPAASNQAQASVPIDPTVGADHASESAATFVHAHELDACPATYPIEAVRLGQYGTVKLAVRVGSDGGVTAVQVISSSGYSALDSAAVSAMEQCRFAPAIRNGQPVVDKLELPISFTLNGM